jgi:class 3 adenylate cyclase
LSDSQRAFHRLVYALFAFQYEVSSLSLYWKTPAAPGMFTFIALSQIVYNSTAFALALITGCSLPCVLRFGAWCLPDDVEAQLQELRGGDDALLRSDVRTLTPHHSTSRSPPLVSPVFVVTDIESSSALWGVGDGLVMQRAVEMHDDILRSLLAKYRGYEITTAGDSFQLAFHTIREAVEYTLAVQMELLAAKWPKELFGLVPATKTERSLPHHLLFRGLRVRMGIHDALDESEGPLVIGVHAVTGKTTYSGVSFEIANEVGNVGAGGQILVTRRVAEWLEANDWLMDTQVTVDRVSEFVIPHTTVAVELFQVLPRRLNKRARFFSNGNIAARASRVSVRDSRLLLEVSTSGEGTLPTSYTSDGHLA